ncbi:MAG: heme peroxidase family protein [Paracoccaceae bacterium]|nr:heme peroxidase family protein [Paracoccaceae bacterium]
MLLSFGHGTRIVLPSDGGPESAAMPASGKAMSRVAPGAVTSSAPAGAEAGLSGTDLQSFGYMFPDGEGVPGTDAATVDALKALAAAMVEVAGDPADANSTIAPIFTYLGQFIDHDITANTDRDAPAGGGQTTEMSGPTVEPLSRADVVTNVMNLRNGSLRLDSLYGEGPKDTPFTMKMREAMRDANDRAKMRIGQALGGVPGDTIPLPADNGADLPRLGDVIDDPASGLTEADIQALPPEMRSDFVDGAGQVKRALAVIGDGRNDENLLVAQLHLAFLRFHNAIADELAATIPDAEARFAEAKRRTTMIYQWLVVNVYLPKICMPSVVDGVKSSGAALYKDFRQRVGAGADELAMPLEFSVAAFRFGHSMVRAEYDHNRNFGRPGNLTPRATFEQLFSFTGGDNLGQSAIGVASERLPDNWPIEWDRFALDVPLEADHRARKIDTQLAPPLSTMIKEGGPTPEIERIMKHLAERNLRRSHRLNIPTGQAAVAAVNAFDQASPGQQPYEYQVAYAGNAALKMEPPAPEGIAPLPDSVLGEGAAGAALTQGGMIDKTPLWYYILKEAEVTDGDTLGPLGSRIVAETLVGLIVEDDQSYWHEGAGNGDWSPAEAAVGGQAITDFPKMLASCGLMA